MNDLNVIFDKCPIYICYKYHHLHFLAIFMALRQEYVPESILKIEGTYVVRKIGW